MTEFLIAIMSGLGVGSIYALIALGFSFIYRTTASFNFAQGQLVTVGSLLAYSLYVSAGLPAAATAAVIVIGAAALGALVERVAIWPLIRRGDDNLSWLISTLGAAILITGAAERIWGTQALGVPSYIQPSVIHFGAASVATNYVVAFAAVCVLSVMIELFQRWTLWGRTMRAVADNRLAVELAGVNVFRLGLAAFALGGALSGIAGFVLAPITYAESTAGFEFAILAFTSFAIGGFASHWGSLLGGLLVGLTESISGTYIGLNYQDIIVLGVLILVLVVRPEGLIAPRRAREV